MTKLDTMNTLFMNPQAAIKNGSKIVFDIVMMDQLLNILVVRNGIRMDYCIEKMAQR